MSSPLYQIRLISYDTHTHHFAPGLDIRRYPGSTEEASSPLCDNNEADKAGVTPSVSWMKLYMEWRAIIDDVHNESNNSNNNHNHHHHHATQGLPYFTSRQALLQFNERGMELKDQLYREFHTQGRMDIVVIFQPLYANVEVGDAVAGWWHLRDKNYGFVVPIQHLPVSDELKSRLMLWRFRKGRDLLRSLQNHNESVLYDECHDLEENILCELNTNQCTKKGPYPATREHVAAFLS